MGPVLGALASVGKEFLAEKAVGLLNGKDKAEEETNNANVEAFEPSTEDDNYNNIIKEESHSAKDDDINVDDLSVPDYELEAIIQDTNSNDKDISDSELAALLPDIEDEPEAATVNDEFSADNVTIPGEQEATQEAEQASFGLEDTNGSGGISTAPTVVPDSTPQYLENAELPIAEGNLPSISSANETIPSLNSTDNNVYNNEDNNELVEAIENKDPVAVENAIESDPVESESILKDNTALDNEAKQATDGGNDAEVNNEAVKEALKQNPDELIEARPNFHDNDPAIERMQARIDRLNNKRDEDFLGPDEYIDENGNIQVDVNWKPEDADEDFLGPDEVEYNGKIHQIDTSSADELAASSDLTDATLPVEEPQVEDIPDEAFTDMEELGVENLDEVEEAPVKTKEQAKAKQRLMHWLKSKHLDQSSKSGPVDSTQSDNHNERLSMAGKTISREYYNGARHTRSPNPYPFANATGIFSPHPPPSENRRCSSNSPLLSCGGIHTLLGGGDSRRRRTFG